MSKLKSISVITTILIIVLTVTAVVLAQGPTVQFTKTVSPTSPIVGQPFTVTLEFSHNYTAPMQGRVTDPNPAPIYLSILTSTITGGAVYSPAINGVAWEGTVGVGSLPHKITFQMVATGIPTSAIASGYPVTNTAYLVDLGSTGSIPPGSLPNETASALILIRPQAEYVSLPTTSNPDGSLTLNAAVDTLVQDNQLRLELPAGTVISGTNIPAGGVQLGYVANHTSEPTGIDRPFAGRRFIVELVSQTPPFAPITPVTFNPPIIFTAFYSAADLAAAGILPSELEIQHSSDGETWIDVPEADIIERGAGTTPENSFVKFQVGHLTDFALVGPAGPTNVYLPLVVK